MNYIIVIVILSGVDPEFSERGSEYRSKARGLGVQAPDIIITPRSYLLQDLVHISVNTRRILTKRKFLTKYGIRGVVGVVSRRLL